MLITELKQKQQSFKNFDSDIKTFSVLKSQLEVPILLFILADDNLEQTQLFMPQMKNTTRKEGKWQNKNVPHIISCNRDELTIRLTGENSLSHKRHKDSSNIRLRLQWCSSEGFHKLFPNELSLTWNLLEPWASLVAQKGPNFAL